MSRSTPLVILLVVTGASSACGGSESESADAATVDSAAGFDSPMVDAPTPDAAVTADARPPDVQARIQLLNQEVFREDDAFASGGTGRMYFFDPQPLPDDDRPSWYTSDGERCTYESGTEWPILLDGGVEWPDGPFYDAGDLQFDVTGAPNLIVFEYYDTAYIRKEPEALQQGGFTHSSFFNAENLPPGQPFTMTAVGGPGVGAFTVPSLSLPADYSVTSPDIEGGTTVVSVAAPLEVSWSPPQPEATFWLLVKDSFSFILCELDDDGSATIPEAAMSNLIGGGFARVTVQAWRDVPRTVTVEDSDGQRVELEIVARHAKIGRFDTSD